MPDHSHIILTINSDSITRESVSHALRREGHYVIEADSAEYALNLALEHRPDIIILDAALVDMDAYELCARLRAVPHTSRSSILFLSASQSAQHVARALDSGGDDYVRTNNYSAKPSSGFQYLAVDYRILLIDAPATFNYRIVGETAALYGEYGNSLPGSTDTGWQTVAFDVGDISAGIKLRFYGDYLGTVGEGTHIHFYIDYGRWTYDDATFKAGYPIVNIASPME